MSLVVTGSQWVGIDVSQGWLDIVLRPAGTYWRVANQAEGWSELLSQLSNISISLIVLESTGGMERGIVQALQQQGLPVAVVNPKRARDFAFLECP